MVKQEGKMKAYFHTLYVLFQFFLVYPVIPHAHCKPSSVLHSLLHHVLFELGRFFQQELKKLIKTKKSVYHQCKLKVIYLDYHSSFVRGCQQYFFT